MPQAFKPGQIVPESGVYSISHEPPHEAMPREITAIKGRRFPSCKGCAEISFILVHAAKHASEVEHLQEDAIGATPG